MSGLSETPRANRIHIAFFGLRNAGKSTLVNAFTGQHLAIVSETPGTTTDPVSKAMEILPLGPCLVTDTAGLDDVGELGAQRVEKSLAVLGTVDVAVWVWGTPAAPSEVALGRGRTLGLRLSPRPNGLSPRAALSADMAAPSDAADPECPPYHLVANACRERKVVFLEYFRGDSVEALKERIAALKLVDDTPGLLDGLVRPGDRVICVCPIDESAPKGRLILPQVQVIRAALDLHATCSVCQVAELPLTLGISDSRFQISKSVDFDSRISKSVDVDSRISKSVDFDSRISKSVDVDSRISKSGDVDSRISKSVDVDSRISKSGDVDSRISKSGDGDSQISDSGRAYCDSMVTDGDSVSRRTLVITDSQAFPEVQAVFKAVCPASRDRGSSQDERHETRGGPSISLTSFSILFARQKGDLGEYVKGLAALRSLKDGDTVLVAEGCTHHRQCNDIGTVKIPKALKKLSGKDLKFVFASGGGFLESSPSPSPSPSSSPSSSSSPSPSPSLIVQCGGCMLTRREVLRRISLARAAGIPIVNYGLVLGLAAGLPMETLSSNPLLTP